MRSKVLRQLFILMIAVFFCTNSFVYAAGSTWSQSDWSGGSGQSNWSDMTRYATASGVTAASSSLTLQTNSNWYNTSWKYRQIVTVTNNSGSDLNNYQIPIYLNTAQLISASKMESDCRDIRVVDASGVVLALWTASAPTADTCNQAATKLWVKIPSLPSAGKTLYVYYGNHDAASVSDGKAVFPIFADFTTGSSLPSGWTKTDIGTAGTASVSGGVLSMSNTNGEDVWHKTYGATHVYSTSTVTNGFVAEALLNSQTNSDPWAKTGITVQNTVAPAVGNGQAFVVATPGNGIAFQYQSQTGELCPGGVCESGIIAPNYQTNGGSFSFPLFLKLTKDNGNQVSGYYSTDGSNWNQQGDTVAPWGVSNTQYVTLFITPHYISKTSTATYSFFYVRSYTASEPAVSSPQNEESPYLVSGNLVSSVYDTGSVNDFGTVSYSYSEATNTSVTLKIRTSNNSDMAGASDFSLCNVISSGADLSANNCAKDRDRYVQYQVVLSSSDGFYTPQFTSFALNYAPTPSHTLNYSASTGGFISGAATQTVYYNDNGSSVTAEPNDGYYFSGWDDNYQESSRTDLNIKADFSAVALFSRKPSSSFVAPTAPKVFTEPSFVNNAINWSVDNVYQMAVSENNDFSKSSWLPYENSYKKTDKVLYIKFRSPDGGESKIYTIAPVKNNLTVEARPAIIPVIKPASAIKQAYKFKTDLKPGDDLPDVKELQKFLNNNGFVIAAKGIGSPGHESDYFGRMTSVALIKFQKANKISPALGFFGPATRKAVMEKSK